MPETRKWLQPLGFALLGVAATAAFEWDRAAAGSDARGDYFLAMLLFAMAGAIAVVCDHILVGETSVKAEAHLQWLERLEDTYEVERKGEKPWRIQKPKRQRFWRKDAA